MNAFSPSLIQLLQQAQSIALGHDHSTIELEHFFMASCQRLPLLAEMLEKCGCPIPRQTKILQQRFNRLPVLQKPSGDLHLGREFDRVIKLLTRLAEKRHETVWTEALFLEAFLTSDTDLAREMIQAGADVELLSQFSSQNASSKTSETLDQYTIDLTAQARSGRLDPVIGRDDEIRRVMEILSRRSKNNPVLIGEPGVGKTAIVEGLALRIISGQVPETLLNKRILSLDLAGLLAGAKYRGEFEERLKALLKDIDSQRDDLILFIDEIHTLVGAGKTEGSMDAGNMLKPALARGALHCIGATTLDEYRQNIEKDPALERRFQKVLVEEPDEIDSIAILRGLKERYELHHQVKILDEAILAAVSLSHRYISDRFLPDKAIDLMDEAAARIKLQLASKPESIDKLDRRLVQLKMESLALAQETSETSKKRLALIQQEMNELSQEQQRLETLWVAERSYHEQISSLQRQLDDAKNEMSRLMLEAQYAEASRLQYGIIPELEQKMQAIQQSASSDTLLHIEVHASDIAEVISRSTGIPVSKLLNSEKQKLKDLDHYLSSRVTGQPSAIKAVSEAIRRSRMGITDPHRPIGSFLFMGPTGVGKTELAKTLTKALFDSEKALIRIDMSEYMEKHSVSRLTGAPPGYVGYDQGGQLTEMVRRHPYSVVLFDEIEKAHPDVSNVLLQILDEGHLTDGQGRVVDFKNTIVIMTTNIGSRAIEEHLSNESVSPHVKDLTLDSIAIQEARQFFKPEVFNRIDDILVFRPLSMTTLETIAQIQVQHLIDRMAEQDIHLTLTKQALEKLAHQGYDPQLGARPLKRIIQQLLEAPLSHAILYDQVKPGHFYQVHMKGPTCSFEEVSSS